VNAVDTNILLYAHRSDSESHEPARELVLRLATDSQRWAIPWPCIYEFLAITTHPRVYRPPTPVDRALEQVRAWLSSPTVTLLSEEGDLFSILEHLAQAAALRGPVFHDAKIAALCLHHGVRCLWTADRDFSRFPQLTTANPLRSGRV
jgi:toxin-antitoxin system PIN domain toxin